MVISGIAVIVVALVFVTFVANNSSPSSENMDVVHKEKWGIYVLDLKTHETQLIYSSADQISRPRLNQGGDKLVFSMHIINNHAVTDESSIDTQEEICSINVNGEDFKQLTNNNQGDLVACWSEDDSQVFFLSFNQTMDIYKMNADGTQVVEFYDSGFHDSDLQSSAGKLAFTRNNQIWIINEDGTGLTQVTEPPRAGEWGNSVLPFGDYDPALNSEGTQLIFERMVDDQISHGIYEIFVINVDGSNETALTNTRYTQGIAAWSHSDEKIVYMVSAIGTQGYYDLYMMNADGSDQHNIIPDYYPPEFLCHHPIFSIDDSKIFFVGEWYPE